RAPGEPARLRSRDGRAHRTRDRQAHQLRRRLSARHTIFLDTHTRSSMADEKDWFMAIGGHQVGPVSAADIEASIKNGTIDRETPVFRAGMKGWTPLGDVPQFAASFGSQSAPRPPVPGRKAHDIDFVIRGQEMQFVEVELDPGECAVAEAGTM